MFENLFNNKKKLVILIIAVFMFYHLLWPKLKEGFIDSGSNLSNNHKMDTNICSINCCGQRPFGFELKEDERVGKLGEKYMSSNLTCTGTQGRGCVCVSVEQNDFMANRGNNK